MINKTFALTGLILSCLFMTVSVQAQNKLKFKPDGKFKIVQMTDMHISLRAGQSEVCYELIEEAIRTEKPDLIVFTGDQVTEYQPEKAWKRLVKQMKQSGVPWTMIFGNHDHEQGLTRDELFDMVKAAPPDFVIAYPKILRQRV